MLNLNNKRYLTDLEWGRVLATAWQEPEFKAKLESDPKKAIMDHFPTITFENVLRIPGKPTDLSEHQLPDVCEGGHQLPPALVGCCLCC